ncbi:MAG: rRNA maturation RNase YbeY [Clostridia bacterium]
MIDILVENTELSKELNKLIEEVAEFTLLHESAKGDVNIAIVDDESIRRMNRDFRGVDDITDVLSFPSIDSESGFFPMDGFLGDIAINLNRAGEQALAFNHSIEREIAFLTVHGMLHLLGYDHEKQEDEFEMFALQDDILSEIKLER